MSERIDLGGGAYLEPDIDRNTPFHRRITSVERIPHTRAGHWITLECGHRCQAFGNLAHAQGKVLCTACRDSAVEASPSTGTS